MKIYRISSKTPFPQLEKDISYINSFWQPKAQRKQRINPDDFSIGERSFRSIGEGLEYLREIYRNVTAAEREDPHNASLYNGWKINLKSCAGYLNKHKQLELGLT